MGSELVQPFCVTHTLMATSDIESNETHNEVSSILSFLRKNKDSGNLNTGGVRELGYSNKHVKQAKRRLSVPSSAIISMFSGSRTITIGGFNGCINALQTPTTRCLAKPHHWSSTPWLSEAKDSLNSTGYANRYRYPLSFPLLVDEERCFNSHTGRVETIKRVVGVPRYPR